MNNKTIDKMAEQFSSPEEMKAYSDAQFKTIQNQNQKISAQEQELEKLRGENSALAKELAMMKASGSVDNKFAASDEEVACVIQIAILKGHAIQRELVTDEIKRLETLVKTLHAIKAATIKKKDDPTVDMSDDELLKAFDNNKAQ